MDVLYIRESKENLCIQLWHATLTIMIYVCSTLKNDSISYQDRGDFAVYLEPYENNSHMHVTYLADPGAHTYDTMHSIFSLASGWRLQPQKKWTNWVRS
jgi:hypothetical protein